MADDFTMLWRLQRKTRNKSTYSNHMDIICMMTVNLRTKLVFRTRVKQKKKKAVTNVGQKSHVPIFLDTL